MRPGRRTASLLTAALLFGGATGCGEDGGTEGGNLDVSDEDVTSGLDPGEEPVIEEEDE